MDRIAYNVRDSRRNVYLPGLYHIQYIIIMIKFILSDTHAKL